MFMRADTRHHFFMIGAVDIKLLFIDAALAAFCIPHAHNMRQPAVHLCARIYNNSLAGQRVTSDLGLMLFM
jgi:hypothetical protein